MLLDFTPIREKKQFLIDFSQGFTAEDLKNATHALYAVVRDILKDVTDAELVFIPHDEDAYDEFARQDEQYQGWNLAHLVLHTTASNEEAAAISSVVARGVLYPREPRLRYEPPWKTVTTRAQVFQRLDESERMIVAYLNAWPDNPELNSARPLSERFTEKNGDMNATASFLHGLMHMDNHLDQMRETLRQARAVNPVAGD